MLWGFAAVAALALLILFLILPGRSTKAQRAPFLRRTFAHRGLYASDQSVPENSLPAFRAAVEAGYGVELDVQLTRDNVLVVFHDDDLKRACGVDAPVNAYTFDELQAFPLFGTSERIPTFRDVLRVIDGKIPMIVELKSAGDRVKNCEETLAHLTDYAGDFCVESFHPAIVRWFYKHAPHILRGQLSEAYRYSHQHLPWYVSFGMSRLLSNFLTRPQFIAYGVGEKPVLVRICERLGAMRVCWTARTEAQHAELIQKNDAVIFERYRPDQRF